MPQTIDLAVAVDALFTGGVGRLPDRDAASAIDKRAVAAACRLDASGVAGDAQADHVHHAGPLRALSHYPAEHYARWRARFPNHKRKFVPGGLGENISTRGVTEADVCVGDVFALGGATIQITQPRQPCWKIDAHTGAAGLMRAVVAAGCAGWFYRVLEPGAIRAGDTLIRLERAEHGITLAELWAAHGAARPTKAQQHQLRTLADLPVLAADWRKRLLRRARSVSA